MDKMKKKQLKRYILWILLAAMVVLLAVMPLLAASEQEEDGPKASILSATVQKGNIEMTMKGGGTLAAEDAMDVTIPSGVKIKSFLVDNGDTVTEGTPVAEVDRVTVMNAILQVKDSMDYLEDQIADAADDTISSTISAPAGGRVKQVFAQSGDSVSDVMLEHGALAVLSLDGRMAVRLERKMSLAAGDTVYVTFGDGAKVSGRVDSNLNGEIVVSVADEDYEVGAIVSVATEDGDRIGSGSLYVSNAWKAAGYSGTIKNVYAKVNNSVSEGGSLFSLADTEYTGEMESAASLHREYEQLLQELFQLYETEVITAPCDGVVSGVDENSAFLLSASDTREDWHVDLLGVGSGEDKGWTVMLLSNIQEEKCTGTDETGETCKAEAHVKGCHYYCTGLENCTAKPADHKLTCLTWCVSSKESGTCKAMNHKADCIEKCEGAAEEEKCPATDTHKPGCIESCISTDGKKDCPATGAHKDDCLERCDKTESCFATKYHYPTCLTHCTGDENCTALNHREDCYMAKLTYVAYAAQVKQVGMTELIVAMDVQTVYEIKTGEEGWTLVNPASIDYKLMITEQTVAVGDPTAFKEGDTVLFWSGYEGENKVKSGEAVYASAAENPEMGDGTGMTGSMDISGLIGSGFGGMTSGSFAGASGGGTSQSTGQELFDMDGEVLMTVTDQSAMHLTITVDEQDISNAYLGQEAQVKIIALKGETFTAEVTQIGAEGTNNGGSSKFTLKLTLPWQENAIAGMNATAEILLYSKMDVLKLPVEALAEDGGKTLVYTATDPETGELTDPVEVTTGVSDGESVEILSGLNLGDTVWYSYYDTLELDHTAKAEQNFGF